MANDIKVNDIVSKEIIRLFEYNFISGHTMDRQYDKTYQAAGAAAGSQIRIKQPQRFVATVGAAINIQDTIEREVTLARTSQTHVALGFTAAELTQDLLTEENMTMFSKEYLDTAIQTICAAVDTDILNRARKAIYNTTGTPGTNPANYDSVTQVKAVLNKFGTPKQDRYAVLTDDSLSSLNAGTQNLFNPQDDKASDYRTGELRKINDIKFFNTDFLARHTNGDADDTAATVELIGVEGAGTVALENFGAVETMTEGTVFTIAGVFRRNLVSKDVKSDLQRFVATADATAVAGKMVVNIEPPLDADGTLAYASISALPQAGASITIEGALSTSYDQNLYYSKQAFVFATQDLKNIGAVREFAVRDEELGVALKFTSQGDINNLAARSRLDILYGFAAVCPWWAVKQWAA